MKIFLVYQQLPPKRLQKSEGVSEYATNITLVGRIEAANGPEAIDRARITMIQFRAAKRSSLAYFPIVAPA